MFRITTLIFIALWLLIMVGGAFYFFHIDENDVNNYKALHQQGTIEQNGEKGRQVKKGILKELWVMKEGKPLHIRLKSDDALLTVEKKESKSEVVEEMSNLVCLMQEELFPDENRQIVQKIEAAKAIYLYRTDSFLADNVLMTRYKIPGNTLPEDIANEKPIFKATASKVRFQIKQEGGVQLQATSLQAEMDET